MGNTLSPTVSINYDKPKRRSYSDALTCPVMTVEQPRLKTPQAQEKKKATLQKSAPAPLIITVSI